MTGGRIRPYGDAPDDGQVQLSFTLPLAAGPASEEAAKLLLAEMGFTDVRLVASRDVGAGYTFFVAYGRTSASVATDEIETEQDDSAESLGMHDIEAMAEANLGREVVVVGACIGSDAHTVGIDAILNMKGFAGDYGLERYRGFRAINMGAQVAPEELIRTAVEQNADAILVSQIVTQKDIHIQQMTQLVDLMEAEAVRDRFLVIAGGPFVDNRLAKELGYDAGFGRGTLPSQVAAFIVRRLIERKNKS